MTLDELVDEFKGDHVAPFYDVAKLLVDGLCELLGISTITDEIFSLKWQYAKVLKHEYEIRPIMEDCQKILGMR